MSLRHSFIATLKSFESKFRTLNRVEISTSAILHNFDVFSTLTESGNVIPILKANAYGHGLEQVASILKARKFPYLAVDGYFEALKIREISKQPVLIMGAIHSENYPNLTYDKFAFVVHDIPTIQALGSVGIKLQVHLELETGMSRHGVSINKLPEVLLELSKYPRLNLEGVMSHLADSDNPNQEFTNQQVDTFDSGVAYILEQGFSPTLFHLAQTAGSAKVASKYADAIRVGIGLYGFNPLGSDDPHVSKLQTLIPALTVISTITKIVAIEAGDTVSYGRTFTAKHAMRIGIVPIGYYEGIPRELSNVGHVISHGIVLPIVGRINMNHMMIDCTDNDLRPGQEVVVLGGSNDSPTSILQIATRHALFPYSLFTRINESLRRIIV